MTLDYLLSLLAREPGAEVDLAEIALLLAREEYPEIDVEDTLAELDAMAHDVRPQLQGALATRVAVLGRYLFHELGFHGNTADYYDPRNSYFNEVLERRTGLPITLSLVVMAVAQRAGLNVQGVALPGHFIVKAVEDSEEVLFDPFHEGRVLSPAECETLVEQVTGRRFEATTESLIAALPRVILVRMLTNLKGQYLKTSDFGRAVRIIRRLQQLLPGDVHQRRDLGVALTHAGEPGKALAHLEAYLQAHPNAADAKTVREMLHKARADVARWN
jgi:regulator of sirC expression with transglutaminase-like and TPR domain